MNNHYQVEKNWLLIARCERDMQKRQVAEMLDVSINTYKRYEDNPDVMPVSVLIKLCNLFDVSIDKAFFNKAVEMRKNQVWQNSKA